jgi:hypothetical protein
MDRVPPFNRIYVLGYYIMKSPPCKPHGRGKICGKSGGKEAAWENTGGCTGESAFAGWKMTRAESEELGVEMES